MWGKRLVTLAAASLPLEISQLECQCLCLHHETEPDCMALVIPVMSQESIRMEKAKSYSGAGGKNVHWNSILCMKVQNVFLEMKFYPPPSFYFQLKCQNCNLPLDLHWASGDGNQE
jgi:hypothetical protein